LTLLKRVSRGASGSLLYRVAAIAAMGLALSACGSSDSGRASTYSLGGTISGPTAAGLVLVDNGETLPVTAGAGTFAFATRFTTAMAYAVTVQNSPPGLTCSVAAGTGTFGTASINNVVVTCSDEAYSIGGAIRGLNGADLVLANGTDTVSVSSGSTSFMMSAPVAYTSSYAITVAAQPQGVSCSVQNGTGTMGAAAVTNVAVICSDQPYTLGGTVNGLTVAGLVLANGSDTLPVPAGAPTFTLPTAVAFSSNYAVTVASQPAGLTCSVSNGSGPMPAVNVGTVAVVCASNAYMLSGSINGLANTGLTLTDGTDTANIPANGTSFTFPTAVAFGSTYHVTVQSQPANSLCTVSNATASMPAGNVSSIAVTCAVTAYTLGGSIGAGTLTATGLVLTDGTDNLAVAANASVFSMPTGVTIGAPYSVTIAAQPAGLVCTVTNGSGTMPSADFNGVQVSCTAREWTWVAGSNSVLSAASVYGTRGVPAAGNTPGQRDSQMNWTDHSGRLWLFGGSDQGLSPGDLDDLWMYDPATGLWTWENGSSSGGDPGSYGTKGVAAAGNSPPSRHSGVTWVDSSGHLWLFGGFNDTNLPGCLNDLWMYDIAANEWTWVGGPAVADDPGSAGAQGVAAPGNLPSSRVGAMAWSDGAGHFWLYGGNIPGGGGLTANDLWMYDPLSGLWTWVSGSTAATGDVTAVFGTQGVAAAGNTPGARQGAATWADNSGHLWLFGGSVYDSSLQTGLFGDLWSYDIASNQWTWIGGTDTTNATGTNGSLGIAATGNTPGGRTEMGFWTDHSGRFWLFGGSGYGPDTAAGGGWLSDLWMFDPTARQWTWVDGPSDPSNDPATYGTQGTAAANNVPGGRVLPVGWVDSNGRFWMFGGYGADTNGYHFDLNDLWKF
jgi:3D (Asp-Asp-Asp) domain-containing protein